MILLAQGNRQIGANPKAGHHQGHDGKKPGKRRRHRQITDEER
jgi:hypothetical protein